MQGCVCVGTCVDGRMGERSVLANPIRRNNRVTGHTQKRPQQGVSSMPMLLLPLMDLSNKTETREALPFCLSKVAGSAVVFLRVYGLVGVSGRMRVNM